MGAIGFVPSPKINWPQNGHFAQKYAYLAYLGLAGSFKALLVGWVLVVASEIDISVLKLLGFETFANLLRVSVSVSENLVSEKKNPNKKNSAGNEVPILGLGPDWDQSPQMVPNKSQFCSHVPNFILVARCQARSNIFLINSTVNNNKKNEIINLIVFVIVCFLSQRKSPYLNAFAECLLLNNVI